MSATCVILVVIIVIAQSHKGTAEEAQCEVATQPAAGAAAWLRFVTFVSHIPPWLPVSSLAWGSAPCPEVFGALSSGHNKSIHTRLGLYSHGPNRKLSAGCERGVAQHT